MMYPCDYRSQAVPRYFAENIRSPVMSNDSNQSMPGVAEKTKRRHGYLIAAFAPDLRFGKDLHCRKDAVGSSCRDRPHVGTATYLGLILLLKKKN